MPLGPPSNRPCSSPAAIRQAVPFIQLRRPSRLDLEFCKEALKGLAPFQSGSGRGGESEERNLLSKESFGFCLAVPRSEAECDCILELVRESGVGAVRLDFSPEQDEPLAARLLRGLKAADVRVLLHFVPPLETASRFTEQIIQDEWRNFMLGCLDCFAGMFEAVEIGSTINRARWSGLDLAGFLAMWEVGHAVCRSRGILLVGPNVTDFEPQYNAGVLGMLAHRKMLPAIHSNNLFAERSMEPEAADHKIMGVALRNLHGYDLRKKIALLARISRRYGIGRNWSTCAFWTIPRVQRSLSHTEEQVADYLVRYYVLCASAGGFERIFWGPLVSYREGLVDDGTDDRSSSDQRDVVTFYAGYPGECAQWRRRPAFHALRGLVRFLRGCRYYAARCAGQGLELHELRSDTQVCIVAWTMNGGLARVADCFAEDSLLALSSSHGRDGTEREDCPDFISESPTYFFWPCDQAPQVLETACPLAQLVAARTPPGHGYYQYDAAKWRGIVVARNRNEAAQMFDAIGPEAICRRKEEASLRKSRNAIWTVADPRNTDRTLVVKKPRIIAWHKRVLDRRKPSKALRSWNGTSELMRRGIETPGVVAYFESTDPNAIFENWFFCEHVAGAGAVRSFFNRFADGQETVEGFTFEEFMGSLIRFVLRMHGKGVYFRDLAGGNVLVKITPPGELEFSLIDTARIRCFPGGMKLRHRLDDLKRLTNKLRPEQQAVFMDRYLAHLNKRFGWRQSLSFKLYAWKVWLKRHKRRFMKQFIR